MSRELPAPITESWLAAVEKEARVDYERDPDEATTGACEALAMAARIRELEAEVENLRRWGESWKRAAARERRLKEAAIEESSDE